MAKLKPDRMTLEEAETLALQGLTFLASDAGRLSRFLTLTGIDPADLQKWDENPGLQGAVDLIGSPMTRVTATLTRAGVCVCITRRSPSSSVIAGASSALICTANAIQ